MRYHITLELTRKSRGKAKPTPRNLLLGTGRRTGTAAACEPSTSFALSGSATQSPASPDPAATESEMSKLQSTVKGLTWFVQKLAEDEPETAAELDVVDATDMPQAPTAQTWSSRSPIAAKRSRGSNSSTGPTT